MASFKKAAVSVAAISVFMTGSAAFADVTAQQVWDNWKGYMTSSGYTVEATESASGGTLTVSDVAMSMDIPEEDSSVAVTLGEMTFEENGDGTVSISVPPELPMRITVDAPVDDALDMGLDYLSTGLVINVSGAADDMTYTYAAAEIILRLTEVIAAGEPVDIGAAEMSIADIAGSTMVKTANLRTTDQKMTTGQVTYDLDIADPEGSGGRIMINGGYAGMDLAATGSMPIELDASDMAAMMKEGFAVDGTISYRGGSSEFNFEDPTGPVQGSTSSDSGTLNVAMSEGALTYAGSAQGMKMSLAGAEIPLPIDLAMQEGGFNITMPLAEGEEEQDFALGIKLGDFSMSDMIWSMFDPAGQLPRDPATIAIDLSGKAKVFLDLMDPEQMATMEADGAMPGELNALDVNTLVLRLAGAELTGAGGFTFNNDDMATFDGIPAPDGAIDLKLTGGNGLLDKLIAMGLVPEDQAMGVRMMMGLFAVPGEGEDTLNSKIEVKPDGQVLANGQRLR